MMDTSLVSVQQLNLHADNGFRCDYRKRMPGGNLVVSDI